MTRILVEQKLNAFWTCLSLSKIYSKCPFPWRYATMNYKCSFHFDWPNLKYCNLIGATLVIHHSVLSCYWVQNIVVFCVEHLFILIKFTLFFSSQPDLSNDASSDPESPVQDNKPEVRYYFTSIRSCILLTHNFM